MYHEIHRTQLVFIVSVDERMLNPLKHRPCRAVGRREILQQVEKELSQQGGREQIDYGAVV